MRISAHAGDGIIEGIEDPELPFYVGVQWHPEEMVNEDSAETLFRAFVEAASAYGGVRRK
jgi:putative glutamine amidotransferase